MSTDFKALEKEIFDGIWILRDASKNVKEHIKEEFPDTYEEEIRNYITPTKLIREDDKLIVVSVTRQGWCGIRKYDEDRVTFTKGQGKSNLAFNINYRETVVHTNDGTRKIDQKYFKEMIATGYITQEEIDKYIQVDSQDELKMVKIRRYRA